MPLITRLCTLGPRQEKSVICVETYELIDPRPNASEAPYTFFLPSPERLNAIGVGDTVKAIFRSNPPSEKWDAERMWVLVEKTDGDWLEGALDSAPSDMPHLVAGTRIRLPRSYVIAVIFQDAERVHDLPDHREYWERCFVDQCVLDGVPVGYLYREQPDPSEDGGTYQDSGWRIRGDMRGLSDDELAQRDVVFVAIGAVLNRDDTWLHLIDKPVGVAFEKDFNTGAFNQTQE
jgi:hypothetical protein